MVKNIVRALVMSGVIALVTTSTQAVRAAQRGRRRPSQGAGKDGVFGKYGAHLDRYTARHNYRRRTLGR